MKLGVMDGIAVDTAHHRSFAVRQSDRQVSGVAIRCDDRKLRVEHRQRQRALT